MSTSANRRNPYVAKKTKGWEINPETGKGEHFKYRNYYDSYWSPLMETLGMSHRPHDTRHTCISMLTVAGVSDKVIKKIVGHKGQGVTEIVYTHFEIEELIDAINKI